MVSLFSLGGVDGGKGERRGRGERGKGRGNRKGVGEGKGREGKKKEADTQQIKLNRQLSHRPSAETLVDKGVLPAECYLTNGKARTIAPGLVGVKRRVERERVKDLLRGWVSEWRSRGRQRERELRLKEREKEKEKGEGGIDVRGLVRRFGCEGAKKEMGWWERDWEWKGRERQREREREREVPARAKVLGLRRFWEGVGRGSALGSG